MGSDLGVKTMEAQRKADKRVKMKASTPEIEWSPCPDIVQDPDLGKTRQHARNYTNISLRRRKCVSDSINLFFYAYINGCNFRVIFAKKFYK